MITRVQMLIIARRTPTKAIMKNGLKSRYPKQSRGHWELAIRSRSISGTLAVIQTEAALENHYYCQLRLFTICSNATRGVSQLSMGDFHNGVVRVASALYS